MRRNSFFLLTILLIFTGSPAAAQRIYRIGALVAEDQFVPAVDGFRKKMAEFGYAEGKNIKYETATSR